MVLTPSKVGIEHLAYYTLTAQAEQRARQAAAAAGAAAAYYAAESPIGPGTWLRTGNLAALRGTEVTDDQLRNYLACLDPGTGEALGRRYKAGGTYRDVLGVERTRRSLAAYDLTLSVPKSISAAWALAPPEVRAEIEAAYMASVEAAVDYLQRKAVVSRKGAGGVERIDVPGGAAFAGFTHTTSRAGDPQLHTHLLVMNRVLCSDDIWRTLDGKAVFDHLYPASLISSAVLRAEISRRLGWAWLPVDERGHADLSGIPQELLDFWSKRHAAVAKAAADMIRDHERRTGAEPTPEQREAIWDKAAILTRDAKQTGHPQDDHQRWADEARAVGHTPDAILEALDAAVVPDPGRFGRPQALITDPHNVTAAITPALAASIAAFAETSRSELTDAHIDAAAAAAIAAHPDLVSHRHHSTGTEIVDEAHRYIADAIRGVLIGTPSDDHAAYQTSRWHSAGLIAAETATAQWLAAPAVDPAVAAGDVDTDGLSPDQAHAARALATSTANGVALVGPAGAGKTSTLRSVAAAVGHQRILAVAPTAKAAGTLGKKIGTHGETVAKALHSPELLPQGGLLIIDEAGQVASRDLAALCGHAAGRGLRVVLAGDHAQQAAITAGGVFDAITDKQTVTTVVLTELHRFQDRTEAAATAKLRRGDPDSLDYHRSRERITSSPAAHTGETAGDWWQQRRHLSTVISAPTMEIVHAINDDIAARRAQLGETGEIVAAAGQRPIRRGDVITTRRNKRKITTNTQRHVRNGDRWIVTGSQPSGAITVASETDPDETAELPPGYLRRWVQLGYATTLTRAQSITVDEALTVVNNTTRLPAAYVGLSRGSAGNWLHVVSDLESADPDAPTDHLDPDAVIAGVLERRHQPVTAADLDAAPLHPSPALHLHAIAHTPPDQPLPVPAGYDARAAINHARPAAADHWQPEERFQAGLQEWLDTLDAHGHPDDELFADPDLAWGDPDVYEPTAAEIAELAADPDHQPPPPDELFADPDLAWGDPDVYEPTAAEIAELAADTDHALYSDDQPPSEQEHDMATATATRPAPPRTKRGVDIAQLHHELARIGLAEWIAGRFNVALGRPGQTERRIECPIHRPGKPGAAAVYTNGHRHTMHCFVCNETHDAISLVEKIDGVSRGDAIRGLAAELGVTGTVEYHQRPQAPPQPRIDLRTRLDRQDTGTDTEHDARRIAALLASLDTPTERPPAHPAWSHAVLAYETAVAAGDGTAARTAASRIAGLADPTARDQLIDAGYWPDGGDDISAVRADIVRSRWDNASERIETLTAMRRRHHRTSDELAAAADEHAWATAVQHWLQDPAAAPLTPAWQQLAAQPPPPAPADAHLTVETVAAAAALGSPATLPQLPAPTRTAAAATAAPRRTAQRRADRRLDALASTADWYHQTLQTHPDAEQARRYLTQRGITPDQWARHRIGWAPDDWHAAHSRLDDDLAVETGIANRSTRGRNPGRPYDHMRGRIIFPISDTEGHVIAFAGRTLTADDDTAKYMNTRNTDLYEKSSAMFGIDLAADEIARTGTAVIVEGYTDVIACHAAGINNAVASCGTAITPSHLDQLRSAGATRITSLLDADPAGRKAAERLRHTAAERAMPTAHAELPPGTDPGDAETDQLHAAIATATPAALSLVDGALDGHNPADAAPTADALTAALEALDTGDDITAAVLTQTLATALGPNWEHIAPENLTPALARPAVAIGH